MVEFRHNVVELQEYHLSPYTFPYSQFLQTKFGKMSAFREFKRLIKPYFIGNNLSVEQIREELIKIKQGLIEKYPYDFDKCGWYDLKVWRESAGNEKELEKYNKKKAAVAKAQETKKRREFERTIWLKEQEEKKRIEREKRIEFIVGRIELLEKGEFHYKELNEGLKDREKIREYELDGIEGIEFKRVEGKRVWRRE